MNYQDIAILPPFEKGALYTRKAITAFHQTTVGLDSQLVGSFDRGEIFLHSVLGQLVVRFEEASTGVPESWRCVEVYTPRPFRLGDGWAWVEREDDREIRVVVARQGEWQFGVELRVEIPFDRSGDRAAQPQAFVRGFRVGETNDLQHLIQDIDLMLLVSRLMLALNAEAGQHYARWRAELAARRSSASE
jgi:hypothetical protein